MTFQNRGHDGSPTLWRRIAGSLIPVRATVPVTEAGEELFTETEPGRVEVIYQGSPADDDNPFPVNQIIQAEHAWVELCNVRLDNDPTTFPTKPYHVDEESGLRVCIWVDSTLAPTHVRIVPEFSPDYDGVMAPANATWYRFEEGFWASLGWEDTDTASGIWKVYYLPVAGEDWVRFYLVALGTDATNYFDVRILVRPFQGAHGVAHA